jgi:ribosomal protein L11 methyltransferase
MTETWFELQMQVPAEGVETISYLLSEVGSQGVVTLEETLDTFVPPDPDAIVSGPQILKAFFPPDCSPEGVRLALEEKLCGLQQIFPDWHIGAPTFTEVRQEDWAEGWKQNFQPFTVGDLLVRPSWTVADPTHRGPVMELDPGMAFGTGTHATTRLCLEALANELPRYPEFCSVLDVGTGSGILAIAAAKLGANRVLGCDIEPDACRIALENAELNQVADRIEITDQPLEQLAKPYQIVLANILAEENIRLAEELIARLAVPGSLILSGILQEKEAAVVAAFASFELTRPEISRQDEWIAVTYRKAH